MRSISLVKSLRVVGISKYNSFFVSHIVVNPAFLKISKSIFLVFKKLGKDCFLSFKIFVFSIFILFEFVLYLFILIIESLVKSSNNV